MYSLALFLPTMRITLIKNANWTITCIFDKRTTLINSNISDPFFTSKKNMRLISKLDHFFLYHFNYNPIKLTHRLYEVIIRLHHYNS
jgi:hypothetical protein